uniref:Uncharacterized protein n=1 Tax=viral metagenome TaxID=1070528 RepID=A0A6C0AGY8_9ZZZZ|tara:strand:+ start:1594 stop:1983 length:390 start_codon:yes stop_codon:yes gene_type:complete
MNQETKGKVDDLSKILIDAFVRKHIFSQNNDINIFTLISSLILIYKTICDNDLVTESNPKQDISSILKNIKEIPCKENNMKSNNNQPFVHLDKMKSIYEFISQKYPNLHSIEIRDVFDIYANIKRIIES